MFSRYRATSSTSWISARIASAVGLVVSVLMRGLAPPRCREAEGDGNEVGEATALSAVDHDVRRPAGDSCVDGKLEVRFVLGG